MNGEMRAQQQAQQHENESICHDRRAFLCGTDRHCSGYLEYEANFTLDDLDITASKSYCYCPITQKSFFKKHSNFTQTGTASVPKKGNITG
jgi:hypothetical protein